MTNYFGAVPVILANEPSGGNVAGAKPVYLVNADGTPASLAATYVHYDGTNLTQAGSILPIAGGGVSANAVGAANNPVTSASAARPTGLTKVFWQCPTQPTNWIAGDEWINNS